MEKVIQEFRIIETDDGFRIEIKGDKEELREFVMRLDPRHWMHHGPPGGPGGRGRFGRFQFGPRGPWFGFGGPWDWDEDDEPPRRKHKGRGQRHHEHEETDTV